MPVNRTLNVAVSFHGTHNSADGSYGGTATYAQTGSTPDLGQIVDANGAIHLDQAPDPPEGYNQNVDIIFTLGPTCVISPDSTVAGVTWASVNGPAMVIEVPEGGSNAEFVVVRTAPNVITIQDKDDDSNTYNYKPFVELTSLNNYRIGVDPTIVNRPKTNR